MAFEVTVSSEEGVSIALTGLDRVFCWRRAVAVGPEQIAAVDVRPRAELEDPIRHRAFGYGTHDGRRRPGRRRVGSMLAANARRPTFWAVHGGDPRGDLIVVDTVDHRFARLVIGVPDPRSAVATLS